MVYMCTHAPTWTRRVAGGEASVDARVQKAINHKLALDCVDRVAEKGSNGS